MKRGICKMCLLEKNLLKSHLVPAAVYDYCRPPGGHAISLGPELVIETDRELKAYLLCSDCETVLNNGGEKWLLPLLARYQGSFPFYELLTKVPAEAAEEGTCLYAGAKNPDIRCDQLMHFAMGVFWKAAVHSWSGRWSEPKIELGKYTEPVRQFLLGERGFPANMALRVGVLPRPVELIMFHNPYRGSNRQFHVFLFYVPGIEFTLLVGKGIDGNIIERSFSGHPLRYLVLTDFSKEIMQIGIKVSANKAKNVEKYFRQSK